MVKPWRFVMVSRGGAVGLIDCGRTVAEWGAGYFAPTPRLDSTNAAASDGLIEQR